MRGVFQANIVDDSGDIVPDCNIEVRFEESGELVQIYDAFEAGDMLGNPFTAGEDGFQRFYVDSGIYRVRAYTGSFERIWRHVIIGTGPIAEEADAAVAAAISDLTDSFNGIVSSLNTLIDDVNDAIAEIGIESDTYTLTITDGLTTNPTGAVAYRMVGNVVTQSFTTIGGTSNSGLFTASGVPESIRPSSARYGSAIFQDNGVLKMGWFQVLTNGFIEMYAGTSGTDGWTASGIKSILTSATITYAK
jgi:hypothetical protein